MPIRRLPVLARAAAASALALAAAAPFAVSAEEGRHADAHVHGVSELLVAVEGAKVEMELRAPGADIVGFEHEAETEADKAAETAALAVLRDPAPLFGLTGCALETVEAHVDGHGEHEHEEHAEHEHEEHAEHEHEEHGEHEHEEHGEHEHEEHAEHEHEEHGEHEHEEHAEHEHEEHAEHEHEEHAGHEHEEHAGEEGGHSEFHAIYALACDAPLTALDLSGFFNAFPNAKEVEVEAVSAHGAHAAEATRAAAKVEID